MNPYERNIMDNEAFNKKLNAITEESRNTTDQKRKDELYQEFFNVAIDQFNDTIAGDITTCDGRTLHTPIIEI